MLNTSTQQNVMHTIPFNLSEKRIGEYDRDNMWDMLSLSQQYAVCSLGQFGYLLTYVRSVAGKPLAILKQNNKVATINEAGSINTKPRITCRK